MEWRASYRGRLRSLSAPYQRDVDADDYEIIVVDNGSPVPIRVEPTTGPAARRQPAPARSGAALAGTRRQRGHRPRTWRTDRPDRRRRPHGLTGPALRRSPARRRSAARPVVTAPAWHLGPALHKHAEAVGYDQQVEDDLLAAADWEDDGYELFSIATPAASSRRGLFGPMGESSSLFMPRALWSEVGGLDERFELPGGGLVNHDLYRRACLLDDVQLVVVLGEGTFHQIHGGAATSSQVTTEQMRAEYETIRGEPHRPPPNEPCFVGHVPAQYRSYLASSVELANGAPRRRHRPEFDRSVGRGRPVNLGRDASCGRAGWYVGDDNGVGADASAVADPNRADDLRASADRDAGSDRWPFELPLTESDRHERRDACAPSDLREVRRSRLVRGTSTGPAR